LDEATSGLDAESARAVHRSLDAIFGDRTVYVITHRATTSSDRLCWPARGRQVEAAPPTMPRRGVLVTWRRTPTVDLAARSGPWISSRSYGIDPPVSGDDAAASATLASYDERDSSTPQPSMTAIRAIALPSGSWPSKNIQPGRPCGRSGGTHLPASSRQHRSDRSMSSGTMSDYETRSIAKDGVERSMHGAGGLRVEPLVASSNITISGAPTPPRDRHTAAATG